MTASDNDALVDLLVERIATEAHEMIAKSPENLELDAEETTILGLGIAAGISSSLQYLRRHGLLVGLTGDDRA